MRDTRPRIDRDGHMRPFPTNRSPVLVRQRFQRNINQRIMTTLRRRPGIAFTQLRHRHLKSLRQRFTTQRVEYTVEDPHPIRRWGQLHPTRLLLFLLDRGVTKRIITVRNPHRHGITKLRERQRSREPQQHRTITLQERGSTLAHHIRNDTNMGHTNRARIDRIRPSRQRLQQLHETDSMFAFSWAGVGMERKPLRHVPKTLITNHRRRRKLPNHPCT